jgi:hypothetical protein
MTEDTALAKPAPPAPKPFSTEWWNQPVGGFHSSGSMYPNCMQTVEAEGDAASASAATTLAQARQGRRSGECLRYVDDGCDKPSSSRGRNDGAVAE